MKAKPSPLPAILEPVDPRVDRCSDGLDRRRDSRY